MNLQSIAIGIVGWLSVSGATANPSDPSGNVSEQTHVPPAAPSLVMHEMSSERMIELMDMDDSAAVGLLLVDQLEWRGIDADSVLAWDSHASIGGDYDKLWINFTGERAGDEAEGRVELLWDRVVGRWWNLQAGLRHDFGAGPARNWLGIGLRGVALHWFEVELSAYVGDDGRTAARFSAEYDVLITQRLILQPEAELEAFGKEDARNGIGSGVTESGAGIRLRYEIRREFAPYVGVSWHRKYGATADFANAAGDEREEVRFVLGLRAWF